MAISDPDPESATDVDGGRGVAGDDSHPSNPVEDGGTATSTATATPAERAAPEQAWYRRYLRESVAHVAVVVLLAIYPGVHWAMTAPWSPVGAEAVMVLPDMETMLLVVVFGLFAMSFDFISGYTGYLSFGHAAFYGAGAYTVLLAGGGKLALAAETHFMILLVLGGLVAAALALVIGAVSFRLTGVYFAMITLGFSQVLYVFVRGWDFVSDAPRDGLAVFERSGFEVGVPFVDSLSVAIGPLTGDTLTLLGTTLDQTAVSYYALGAVVLVCYLAMQRIIHSPFGTVMIAIRENEERARAVGYNTLKYKLGAFVISGFFAGIAGGLFAGFKRSATPENSFFFLVTGDALLAAIIGGFGTLAGPLYGRLFDATVKEFLSKSGAGGGLLPYLRAHLGQATMGTELVGGLTVAEAIDTFLNGHASLYIGVVFVLFVLYVPNGILGTVRDRLGGTIAKVLPTRLGRWLQ